MKDGYGGQEARRLLHVEPVYGITPKAKPDIETKPGMSDDGQDDENTNTDAPPNTI